MYHDTMKFCVYNIKPVSILLVTESFIGAYKTEGSFENSEIFMAQN